jgi:hypothetical protein
LNVNEWTLKRFLSTVVKEKLGFEDPTVMLQGGFIWEEGSVADSKEFMPNLPKTFAKLPCGGIQHGTILELDDASQNLTIQVSVSHKEHWDDANKEEFPFVVGALPSPKKVPPLEVAEAAAKPQQEQPAATTMTTTADDDDVVLVLDDEGTARLDSRVADWPGFVTRALLSSTSWCSSVSLLSPRAKRDDISGDVSPRNCFKLESGPIVRRWSIFRTSAARYIALAVAESPAAAEHNISADTNPSSNWTSAFSAIMTINRAILP